MSRKFEVRPYRPGDEEEIVEFLRLVFNGWPHFDLGCDPIDHWMWKYLDNPIGRVICTLGVSDDCIIGCFHSPLLEVKIGDSIYLSSQGGDQAVHPDYRRMGVYTKMRELAQELRMGQGVKFHFSGSIVPVMIDTSIRRGESRFPHIGKVYARIRDIDLHLRTMPEGSYILNKYGFHAARLHNKIKNALASSRPSNNDLTIGNIKRFDERIDSFWDKISEGYLFIVKRTREYLNWRYCDPRGGSFDIKLVEESGQILGYCVLRINKFIEGYPVGWIVDLLTYPDRVDVTHSLVEDAANHFDRNDVNIAISLVNKKHFHEGVLKKYEFLNSRQGPFRVYAPHADDSKDIKKFKESHVNKIHNVFGDYDWI